MSKLSLENEIITARDKKVCACGRKIMRVEDQAKGICRICNPFSLRQPIKPMNPMDWREGYLHDRHVLRTSDYD